MKENITKYMRKSIFLGLLFAAMLPLVAQESNFEKFKQQQIDQFNQFKTDRSGHTPSEAEAANRTAFGLTYGKERHREFIERTMKGQLEIEFTD